MALDTTIGGASANSYLLETEADSLLEDDRLYGSAWTAADTDVREAALRWATALIDTYFTFDGAINDHTQRLRWPRYNSHDSDGRLISQTIYPIALQRSTAALALELLKRDRSAEPTILGLGIREGKVGSVNAVIDKNMILDMVPDSVVALMYPIGFPSPATSATGSSTEVRLHRS